MQVCHERTGIDFDIYALLAIQISVCHNEKHSKHRKRMYESYTQSHFQLPETQHFIL